ncbi:MAG: B12-binding domain-containing radical SAM protein, partial [Candidatus Omnitrophica bacterium]|nr:B12-binding domain-containing radical SAM protein [Candidatus Omnitrophota bacterium]
MINPKSKFIDSHRLYKRFLPPVAPLGLAYIAAVLEANGVNVSIIDMFANKMSDKEILEIIKNTRPEIIGLSVLTPVINDVTDLVSQIRSINKEVKIILGNTHPSCFPHQLLEKGLADIVVRGEGEITMACLSKALSNGGNLAGVNGISYSLDGNIFHNPDGEIVESLDDLPHPAFHLLDLDRYKEFPLLSIYNRRFLPISASRGCPYQCYFCSQDKVSKSPRYRAIGQVVDEIEYFHQRFNIGYFCFTDAYFPFSESTGLEFCSEIIQRRLNKKIKWITESRVDKVSKRLLEKMKKAGAALIMYGVEVGNQEVLNRI